MDNTFLFHGNSSSSGLRSPISLTALNQRLVYAKNVSFISLTVAHSTVNLMIIIVIVHKCVIPPKSKNLTIGPNHGETLSNSYNFMILKFCLEPPYFSSRCSP